MHYNNLAQSDLRADNICDEFAPKTEQELRTLLALCAHKESCVIRPYGGRHSWSPSVVSHADRNVVLINTQHLGEKRSDAFVPIPFQFNVFPTPSFLIPAPAYFEPIHLIEFASSREPPLSINPTGVVQRSIRLPGFCSSACHGSGKDLPPVGDAVMAMRMVCVDEKSTCETTLFIDEYLFEQLSQEQIAMMRCHEGIEARLITSLDVFFEQDPEFKNYCNTHFPEAKLMDFVRANYGSLGIITELWIRGERQFDVMATDEILPMVEVVPLASNKDPSFVDNYLLKNDYLELFYSPFNSIKRSVRHFGTWLPEFGEVQIKRANRYDPSKHKAIIVASGGRPLYHSKLHQAIETKPTEKKRAGQSNNLLHEEDDLFVEMGGDFMELVVKHPDPKLTPLLLQIVGQASYGRCMSKTGTCLACLNGCAKFEFEETPVYHRRQTFNDFSLYEVRVMKSIVDPEMEIPIDLRVDPSARVFRQAWYSTLRIIRDYAKRGQYPCGITVHVRFNGASKTLLSSLYVNPAHMHPKLFFATLECLCIYERDAPESYLLSLGKFIQEIMAKWKQITQETYRDKHLFHRARPHLAKSWYALPDKTTSPKTDEHEDNDLRPHVNKTFEANLFAFNRFRRLIDPNNVFYGGLVKCLDEK